MVKFCAYGSLRKGEYNYESFVRAYGEENFQYINTKTIPGYQLYSLGSYPMILKDPNGSLVVDEFLVSPEVANSIRRMEIGAGYKEGEIDGALIYYYEEGSPYYPKVESGDWSKYLKEREIL